MVYIIVRQYKQILKLFWEIFYMQSEMPARIKGTSLS